MKVLNPPSATDDIQSNFYCIFAGLFREYLHETKMEGSTTCIQTSITEHHENYTR